MTAFSSTAKRRAAFILLTIVCISRDVGIAEVLPVPNETRTRIVPTDENLKTESVYKKLYDEEKLKEKSDALLESKLRSLRSGIEAESGLNRPQKNTNENSFHGDFTKRSTRGFRSQPAQPVQPEYSYVVTQELSTRKTVVPVGSTSSAVLVTGIEANSLEPAPMLLSLQGPFILPNNKRLDLSSCFMLAKSKANLSVERVIGETFELSCIRSNGEHIRRPAHGYISGADGTFGIQGKLISNQKQVFLTAVLASLAKGAGEAVAMAQKTTTVVSTAAGSQSASNVTGSQALLAAGQATTDAASMIAEWYLTYAKQLVPSIAVGSGGQRVWVTLLDSIEMPPLTEDEEE